MANVRCSICTQREVGIVDIIHGGHGDRYQVCSHQLMSLKLAYGYRKNICGGMMAELT